MELQRDDAYELAARAYASDVRGWDGAATLVASGKRLAANPLKADHCGWARHIKDLELRVVDCEHLELCQDPWVAELASKVAERIEPTQDALALEIA